jgi:hypothetical protein
MSSKEYKLQVSEDNKNKVIREMFGSKKEGAQQVDSSSNASVLYSGGAPFESRQISFSLPWFSAVPPSKCKGSTLN